MEALIESAISGANPQGRVEHEERLAHRVDDILRVGFDVFKQRFFDQVFCEGSFQSMTEEAGADGQPNGQLPWGGEGPLNVEL